MRTALQWALLICCFGFAGAVFALLLTGGVC